MMLHFEVHGRGRGRPILALHGFASTRESWRALVPLVGERELWLFDLKGHGASPCPASSSYSVQDQADLVLSRVLQAGMQDVTLIGHSLGGAVALLVSIMLVKEGRGRLSSLVLIDSLYRLQDLPIGMRMLRAAWPIALALEPAFGLSKKSACRLIGMAAAMLCRHPEMIRPAAVAAYAENLRRPRMGAMIRTMRDLTPSSFAAIAEGLSAIDVPTLIIWGQQDWLLPWQFTATTLQMTIPGSTLRLVEDCGHIPHEEWPDPILREVVVFLTKGASPATSRIRR